ncbi:efflux RND transporter periplasmic adaptor subunit [Kineobactrum salinum]|uniref:Efflux RND transporter periplasmic adaptor subunit n=1 Tax=Kineobactrum salinum TaxID=2708301 RepID=A0A6C0U0K9_9GAMM|nr:efflux RND transporter periplasmic adaptor subunit [Kineobactrum salinum]QIB65561.1 efflux RND transporter periplasmic adaptor subunit [Kineobactrum salinum]
MQASSFKLTRQRLLPWIVLAGLLLFAALALYNPPEAGRRPPSVEPRLSVETVTIVPASYQVVIDSYGSVRPRTRNMLVSQVAGEVTWINPQFRDGGVFRAGDELLRIDSRDYEADVQIARASLLEARQLLAEEEALSQQALENWQRLGDGGEPGALVLRKPQLLAAQADLASAEAALRKAELSLERTRIKAPFDGRVLTTEADIGQVISANAQLAEIYASDYVEIRLPLANSDLAYIDLPEPRRRLTGTSEEPVRVTLHSQLAAGSSWQGFLVRTEGAIDEDSRQLHVVAQVDDPFALEVDAESGAGARRPLKIGEYVTARIAGRQLARAIVIDISAIYQGSYVYVVEEGLLQRREIEIAWQNDREAVISSGLAGDEQLVVTPLGQVTSGTRVTIVAQQRQVVQSDAASAGRGPRSTGSGHAGPPHQAELGAQP